MKRFFKGLGNFFKGLVNGFKEVLTHIVDNPLTRGLGKVFKVVAKAALRTTLFVFTAGASEVFGFYEPVEGLIKNTFNAMRYGVSEILKGIFTLDFKRVWSGFKGVLPAVIATASAILTGGASIPASLVILDSSYNQSALTTKLVSTLGELEHAVFGTEMINRNTDLIVAGLTLVSVAYAGSVVGGALSSAVNDFLSFSSEAQEAFRLIKGGYSAFKGGYDLYQAHQNAKLYKEQFEQYALMIMEYESQIKQNNEALKSALLQDDVWDFMAGGVKFNATFAGQEDFQYAQLPHIGFFKQIKE